MADKKSDETQVARNQWNRYTRARDSGHLDYCDMAKKCDRYYRGDQWDDSDVLQLESEGRPHLTINTILATVNTVLGHQASQRADVIFKPRRNTDQGLADTMTKVFKHTLDNNDYEFVESQVFSDGVVQDRGYFDVRIDYDDHMNGEIRIEAEDPLDIIPDPDAKDYDPKYWQEVFKTRWMSLDEIEELYGKDKADSLRYIAESGAHYGRDSFEFRETTEGFGDTDLSNWRVDETEGDEGAAVRAVRIIERQHRKLVNTPFFLRPASGDMRQVPGNMSDDDARTFAESNGLTITKKIVRRVKWTVTADQVVLHDDWSPYSDFTIVPYFPYFRRGKPFGIVRNLLSPQEQLNKVTSQELHIVNTTANSGWIVENGSLSNMDEDDLMERGAETGLVLVHNRGSQPPVKISPNQIPTGLDRIAVQAQNHIKTISGVSDALLGTEGPEVSGVAIEQKRGAGQVQIQVPMENLRRTRQILAKKVLGLTQAFYTEPRILQITNEDDPMKPREEMPVNSIDPQTGQVINDLTIGEYDLVVGSAPARDNFNDMQFAQALSLRQAGVMIPDDLVIEYSQLHRKAELSKMIRQMQGREQTPEQQQISEMQKQMALQSMQLELAKLEAEVQKLAADAALQNAKARAEGVSPEIDLHKIETDLQRRQQELATRLQMSQMGRNAQLQQAELSSSTKMAQEAIKNQSKGSTNNDESS